MNSDLLYRQIQPDHSLVDFVDCFWMLETQTDQARDVVVLPDGRIDMVLAQAQSEPFHILLMGLGTVPTPATMAPRTRMVAISFKPLAIEYILRHPIADLVDTVQTLPTDSWGFSASDLLDFELFVKKASTRIQENLEEQVDDRKRKLFNLIYETQGSMPVNELAENVYWSSRQINRYFNQQYGVSLKTYCRVLRFRATFTQIKEGKLFPEQAFADQAHFIKEIRNYSGTIPKELFRNKNGRFIQFSALSSD
jgi:AraC-like DNA-binding protein